MDQRVNGSTQSGGMGARFPSTSWSMVCAAQDRSTPEGREQLERLASRYWKPVYSYIRKLWSKSNEDAKDLTQGFFAHLLEADTLSQIRPQEGSLRAYLKAALSNFLVDQQRRDQAAKRGGGVSTVPMDFSLIEGEIPDEGTPDEVFDREWIASSLTEAVELLGKTLREEGREIQFRVFEAYYKLAREAGSGASSIEDPPEETSTYPEVAAKLGLKPHDVKNYLIAARRRLRGILEEKIRDTTASEQDAAGELRFVLDP